MKLTPDTIEKEFKPELGGKMTISYNYREPENYADCTDLCGSEARACDLIGQRNKARISSFFTDQRLKGITTKEEMDKLIKDAQSALETGNLVSTRGTGVTANAKKYEELQSAVANLSPNASAEEKLAALRAMGLPV